MRVRAGTREADADCVAAEEPLEVRLHGRPFAVIMRTPGSDRELAAGFLLAERVLRTADDLGTIEHCTDPSVDRPGNVVNVTLAGGSTERLERMLAERRQVTANSSCGLCGRQMIESLRVDVPVLTSAWTFPASRLSGLPERLRAAQSVFETTGGLHAAGLFDGNGQLEEIAEDVGRHNAVDKIIGRMLMLERLPLSHRVLFVSGRTSFEIVQKAWLAGIPDVASVSAPSTLAVTLAADSGIALVGFVRGESYNVYAHPERLV
jgi:FdhD protein